MVGIAGRSKACRTCKRRKIKCDETKPICLRCRKAYMMCEGYADEGERTFVDESAKFTASTFILQRHGPVEIQEQQQFQQGESSRRRRQLERPNLDPPAVNLTHSDIPPNVELAGFEIDIAISFTLARLFPGNGPVVQQTIPVSPWILDAIAEDQTRTVYYATCGLSLAYFGNMEKDQRSVEAGAVYYGLALHQLNHNLKDPHLCWNPGNIAAAVILVVYELSVFNNRISWIQHASGLETIVRTGGPQSFKEDPARKYYMISRYAMIARALTLRRRTFLEERDWQTVPWEAPDAQKPVMQYLLDILASLPGLLEKSDSMEALQKQAQDAPSDIELKTFRNRLTQFMGRLFAWRYCWEAHNANKAYEVDSQEIFPVGGEDTLNFDSVLYYREFHTAGRTIMLYNVGLLLALDLAGTWNLQNIVSPSIVYAKSLRAPPQQPANPLILPHENLNVAQVAHEIRRSVQYHLQGPHVYAGAMFLLLPLRLLSKFCTTDAEKQWLFNVVEVIGQASGFVTSGEFLAQDRPKAPSPTKRGKSRSPPNPPTDQARSQSIAFFNIVMGQDEETGEAMPSTLRV